MNIMSGKGKFTGASKMLAKKFALQAVSAAFAAMHRDSKICSCCLSKGCNAKVQIPDGLLLAESAATVCLPYIINSHVMYAFVPIHLSEPLVKMFS